MLSGENIYIYICISYIYIYIIYIYIHTHHPSTGSWLWLTALLWRWRQATAGTWRGVGWMGRHGTRWTPRSRSKWSRFENVGYEICQSVSIWYLEPRAQHDVSFLTSQRFAEATCHVTSWGEFPGRRREPASHLALMTEPDMAHELK